MGCSATEACVALCIAHFSEPCRPEFGPQHHSTWFGSSLLSQHLGGGLTISGSQVTLRVQGHPGVHEALPLKREVGRKENATIP